MTRLLMALLCGSLLGLPVLAGADTTDAPPEGQSEAAQPPGGGQPDQSPGGGQAGDQQQGGQPGQAPGGDQAGDQQQGGQPGQSPGGDQAGDQQQGGQQAQPQPNQRQPGEGQAPGSGASEAPVLEEGSGVPPEKRRGADARECLKFKTDKEIAACAEKFRHRD